MSKENKLKQRTRRYKCRDQKLLIYSDDDMFAYITKHNIIALYNGSMKFAEVEMLQTGLFDKNGKDIFEHDIIKTQLHGEEIIGVVKYANKWGTFYLSTKNKYKVGIALDSVHQWYYAEDDDFGTSIAEVVGNIHENKCEYDV